MNAEQAVGIRAALAAYHRVCATFDYAMEHERALVAAINAYNRAVLDDAIEHAEPAEPHRYPVRNQPGATVMNAETEHEFHVRALTFVLDWCREDRSFRTYLLAYLELLNQTDDAQYSLSVSINRVLADRAAAQAATEQEPPS